MISGFEGSVGFAFLLTLLAGLSTGVGGAIAFFTRRTNRSFLAGSLGFSAGVMIYVSFVEMFPKAMETLQAAWGDARGAWLTAGAFFGGMLLIGIIDRLVPSFENPHEMHRIEELHPASQVDPKLNPARLHRMGMMTALAIAIHNFPEGLVTFTAAMHDPSLGLVIAIAIAIHNIPEGIAVSVPIYFATGSRRKAFWYSLLSGLAEPVGAILGFLLLAAFMGPTVMGVLFAGVAGIMVFISLDELLPGAQEYGKHHVAMYWMIIGMGVMALSLLLLAD